MAMSQGNLGCPHEEGGDFPHGGGACTREEYWQGCNWRFCQQFAVFLKKQERCWGILPWFPFLSPVLDQLMFALEKLTGKSAADVAKASR